MRIETTFDEAFDDLYNRYNATEKGKQLLIEEGISRDTLDIGKMSKDYFKNSIADVTIDQNANGNENKSYINYSSEIVKGLHKLDGYYLIHHYATKMFGIERANELLKAMWDGDVYFHDASKPQIPYSYFGDTTLIVRYHKTIKMLTMRDLYKIYKFGDDIQIWDGYNWKDIRNVIKHIKHNNLLCINTDAGQITVVTEDHPVILQDGSTKLAQNISIGDKLAICNEPAPYIPITSINKNKAYILGMIAGDGYMDSGYIHITQTPGRLFDHITKVMTSLNLNWYINPSRPDRITVGNAKIVKEYTNGFNADGKSYTKRVPHDIISWDKESIVAYLSGLYDAEGNSNNNLLNFRVNNFGLAVQFYELLKIVGVQHIAIYPYEYHSKSGYKPSCNIIYMVSFELTEESVEMFNKHSFKLRERKCIKKELKYCNKTHNIVSKVIPIKSDLDIFDEVYDITVDGEKFYCQGLIQHNCIAYSTTFIMNEGCPYGQLHSLPPKHAKSFMGQAIETTMNISQEFAGAVALGDLIVNYAWYAKKDNLTDDEIVNDLQSFVHVMNNKFRVSGECVDAETEVLTPTGFKTYETLHVDDDIYVWDNGKLTIQKVERVNIYEHHGEMHQYRGRDIEQVVTPNHNVFILRNNPHKYTGLDKYLLKPSSELISTKTSVNIPISTLFYDAPEYEISDAEIQLAAIILCDGNITKYRTLVYKSPTRFGNGLIVDCLSELGWRYSSNVKTTHNSFGLNGYDCDINEYSINIYDMSPEIKNLEKHYIPNWVFSMSRRQINLFIDTWALFDGHTAESEYNRQKLQVDSKYIADQIQHLCVLGGRGSRITERVIGENKKATMYVIPYIRHSKFCNEKNKIQYDGIVWCPTTQAGIVIYRKSDKIFISGNSPFTNLSLFDKPNLEKMFEHYRYPDGTSVDYDYVQHIQDIFARWFAEGDPVSGLPYRFPVVTLNVACNENRNVIDQEFLNWVSEVNLKKGCFNIYVNTGNKIASCCRLINDADRMPFRADTFGNGGINVGSHRVVTINLPRIALKSCDIGTFYWELARVALIVEDLLQVHREGILQRRVNQGFLKFYNPLKWFNLDHLFSTIGIIGIYEMCQFMGLNIRSEEGTQFATDVLTKIEEYSVKFSRETGHSFNVEEIPGESVASKLVAKDRIMFGAEKIPCDLYSNQYIPLTEDVLLPERVDITGKFQDILSGGGILHLNVIDEIKDPAVMRKIIIYAVKHGVSHLAINYGFGICENGHTTICGNSDKCSMCGAPIKDHITRVIGYFAKVSNWGKTRRGEFPKRVFKYANR